MARRQDDTSVVEIQELKTGSFTALIVGLTPIICNSMNAKAQMSLLLPQKKTAAEKASSLKHDPIAEYRRSPYRTNDPESPTLIYHPGVAWKKAIAQAAVDIPGAAKAQIGRLVWIEGRNRPLFGIPQMFMTYVRSADMNRTPDIRTRAIIPEWASEITVTYMKPNLTEKAVLNLLGAAGLINGMGDWRSQKGGSHGQFRLCSENDPLYKRIVKTGGREAQEEALMNPTMYDLETEELFDTFLAEINRIGRRDDITLPGELLPASATTKEPSTNGHTNGTKEKKASKRGNRLLNKVAARYGEHI